MNEMNRLHTFINIYIENKDLIIVENVKLVLLDSIIIVFG
jgi:hypothetical protein